MFINFLWNITEKVSCLLIFVLTISWSLKCRRWFLKSSLFQMLIIKRDCIHLLSWSIKYWEYYWYITKNNCDWIPKSSFWCYNCSITPRSCDSIAWLLWLILRNNQWMDYRNSFYKHFINKRVNELRAILIVRFKSSKCNL